MDFRYPEAYGAALVYYLAIVSVLMVVQAQLEKRFTWTLGGGAGAATPFPRSRTMPDERRCGPPRRRMSTSRYDELEVLRGVTFDVGRGEVKVIIGPSGSGKSTLLRCLALLEPVDSGSVHLDGDELSGLREKELAAHRSEVGMVFQRFNLFQNMTALGNVMCGLVEVRGLKKREARERAREFLDARRARRQGGASIPRSSRAASSSAWRSRARS